MTKIALVQMVSTEDIDTNLQCAAHFIEQAKMSGAVLVLLPENFAFMGEEQQKLNHAETFGQGKIQDTISALARMHRIWILAGTIPVRAAQPDHVRAASLIFNEEGHCVERYDKIHLFDVMLPNKESYRESTTIECGDRIVTVQTPAGMLGLSVCYDVRFPELYRQLALQGAELFAIPSAFTKITGKAHWEILLRARAIENLCYVLAPDQGGLHANGRETYGHSMVVEPWGDIAVCRSMGAGLITADIQLDRLKYLRRQFPCADHHVIGHENRL